MGLFRLFLLALLITGAVPQVLAAPSQRDTSVAHILIPDWKRSAEIGEFPIFDGFGALSAGASSRLLLDYPAAVRDEILDLLFTPGRGLALQILKVEVGAGVQATDGSEVSILPDGPRHVDCNPHNNYELWLIHEAKRRNPNIRLGALEWGAPAWVKNHSDHTLFTRQNMDYLVEFLRCVRTVSDDGISFLGIWNESPWGGLDYALGLRQALNRAGFARTELVLLDAISGVAEDFNRLLDSHPTEISEKLAPVKLGLHYACTESGMPGSKELFGRLRRLNQGVQPANWTLKVWASEEWSTPADWEGAGCLGRMLNSNFVRMNMTASIAWSLIWSAYPNEECFGQGLLYAFSPWSGRYEQNPTIYAAAHTTHFTKAGKSMILNAGVLESGGSWIVYGIPSSEDAESRLLTVVVETLLGACQYHNGCPSKIPVTGPQQLLLKGLCPSQCEVGMYRTNRTSWWVHNNLQTDDAGSLRVVIGVDELLTLTTWKGASNLREVHLQADSVLGVPGRPISDPFPLPFSQDFDAPELQGLHPPFFADQGGNFIVKKGELVQTMQSEAPIPWGAPGSQAEQPWTMIGDTNWTDVTIEVSAKFGSWVALCGRITRYQFFGNGPKDGYREGYCLRMNRTSGEAGLYARDILLQKVAVPHTTLHLDAVHHLKLMFHGTRISSYIDGIPVAESLVDVAYTIGNVGLGCWWQQQCTFDNLSIRPATAVGLHGIALRSGDVGSTESDQRHQSGRGSLQDCCHSGSMQLYAGLQTMAFDYHTRSCTAQPTIVPLRNNFAGEVGLAFTAKRHMRVISLQRRHASGNSQMHMLALYVFQPGTAGTEQRGQVLANISVQMGAMAKISEDGWVSGTLKTPIVLEPNQKYMVLSHEEAGGDFFVDMGAVLTGVPAENVELLGSAYRVDGQELWHWAQDSTTYGPVNAVFEVADANDVLTLAQHWV